MDGSDDGYESYLSFRCSTSSAAARAVHATARRLWTAVTWQFTPVRHGDARIDSYYDWMHHGESYTFLHYFGLADPATTWTRACTEFAAMYIGEDPEAPNWDPVHKIIRRPSTAPRARAQNDAEDWVTHRENLSHYLSPYEDIPGSTGRTRSSR